MSLRSAAAHRNLLYLLSLKELRTRYKKSVLGWAWSLLNPMSRWSSSRSSSCTSSRPRRLVGDPSGLKNFPLYFLAGLLPFNFFAITRRCVDRPRPRWRRADQEGPVPPRAPGLLGRRCPVRDVDDRARSAHRGDVDRRQHGAAVVAGPAAGARCCSRSSPQGSPWLARRRPTSSTTTSTTCGASCRRSCSTPRR